MIISLGGATANLHVMEENEGLKKCNECMQYQLIHKSFDCCCSLDDSCAWDDIKKSLDKIG